MHEKNYRVVIDTSVTMAWLFEDEKSDVTDAVLNSLNLQSAVVPAIWSLEVANVLLVALRQKRIRLATATEFKAALKILPIQVENQQPDRVLNSVFDIASEQNLSSYDAAYLELALRRNLPLASLDKALIKCAKKIGVSIY